MKPFVALASLMPLVADLPAHAAEATKPEKSAYLFSYFVGNGEDGLHLAWSADGYKWQALGNGKSYLRPEVGENKLMRDPSLLRGPDGTFHMVWTTSWNGKTIGYASSRDLLQWTPQKSIPVMGDMAGVRNCWAPELAYDDQTGEFVIVWSSTIEGRFPETAGQSEDKYNHRMYFTTTKDFQTFAPAKIFLDPGYSVIDGTILKANNRFYLIFKDETRYPKPHKDLRIATSNSITGPYENISAPITRAWVEGPTVLKIGDEYLLYFDAYTSKRYEALRSRDLQTWEDISKQISFPQGTRHGTALQVPHEIVKRLLEEN